MSLSSCSYVTAVAGPSRLQGRALQQPILPNVNRLLRSHHQRRYYSNTKKKACSKCGKPLPLSELSCVSCGTLQALPTSLDAYDLLGIDIGNVGANGWHVDLGQLKTLWRKRVALSHPDRMGGKDEVSPNEVWHGDSIDPDVFITRKSKRLQSSSQH
jgi:hypothetical protein